MTWTATDNTLIAKAQHSAVIKIGLQRSELIRNIKFKRLWNSLNIIPERQNFTKRVNMT